MALAPTQTAVAVGLKGFSQMQNPQTLGLMLAIAAIIALVAGAWMWSQSPDYRVLYTNVSDRDGGAIISALQQMNVPYKFAEGGGAILVPGTQVHEVRLRLASQGLPKGGLAGFELMENQKLGASQFLEQVNYQRALEGELARSIQSLSAVQNARVHLAISKPSVFVREQQKSSASVLLNLFPGRSLDPAQVSAIVHLISSSVPDLPVKNVAVVDQGGTLLSSTGNTTSNAQLDSGQLKYVHELEQNYVKRIEAILIPITGINNVRAQVTADVDFSQIERAEEIYKPNQTVPGPTAIRSQQSTESATGGPQASGGVPGALSNQPPAPASAPITAASSAAGNPAAGSTGNTAAAAANTRKESTVNYEVDKTIRHVRQPVGGVKRLSVAVVVNYRKQTDAAGKASHTPLAAEEIAKINDLVKETMGYNKDRGDTLNVANSPFSVAEREVIPDVPLWKQPATFVLAKEVGKHLLIAAAVLYLMLGVLRPLLKKLAEARPTPALPEGAMDGEATVTVRRQGNAGYEQNLQMAKQLANQEPKIVANVVKDWVSGDER